jgi:hypothetical protein
VELEYLSEVVLSAARKENSNVLNVDLEVQATLSMEPLFAVLHILTLLVSTKPTLKIK